jgi:hypothetical protein
MSSSLKSVNEISREGLMRGVVVSNEDPSMEGRVALNVPKLVTKHDPKKVMPIKSKESIDTSNCRNEEIKDAISASVETCNYIWFRPVFNNCFLVPYVGQVVYCFLEDGDIRKAYYLPQSATLNGEVTPMDRLKATADKFDAATKPKIHVIQEYHDGTIIYHNENAPNKRLAITFKNNHSISINENPEENSIELITESKHKIVLDQRNKQILIKTSGGHTILMDDLAPKILLNTTAGHKILMDDQPGHITVQASSGGVIKMGGGSGGGTVNIN